jgi:hypothetical protein
MGLEFIFENISVRRSGSASVASLMFNGFGSSLQKIEKNRDRLFTFLDFDNVPWNNNNAEHAVSFHAPRNGMATSTAKND